MLKRNENRTYALDARETAPASATANMFEGKDPMAKIHVSVAGTNKMTRWITMKIYALLLLMTMPSSFSRKLLYNAPENRLKTRSDKIIRLDLAKFFERVAADPESLINGSLVEDIAADLAEVGSIITLKDLVEYEPIWRTPVEMPLRSKGDKADLRLITCPPPSSGVLVGLALNVLAKYNYIDDDGSRFNGSGTLYFHRMAEVFKFVFARRSHLTSECCSNKEEEEFLKKLMTLEAAEEMLANITDNETHNASYYGPLFTPTIDEGTSHVSLIGPNGDAISVTSTINMPFGSGIVGSRTGILFNNEMNDFSVPGIPETFRPPPSPKHFIKSGARPISSMSPLIISNVSNGTCRLVIGAAGGVGIITSTIQAVYASLNLGMNVKNAIDSIRIHHQLLPDELLYETWMPAPILEGLKNLGHNIAEKRMDTAVEAIEVTGSPCPGQAEGHCLLVNTDHRRGGGHDGF
ncbi:hypothetical protein Aperf_G00000022112 [Anoplocephala perfoliata]